jgi:enamine deaminase RidA (YjgF/YER057c/UK114 family)
MGERRIVNPWTWQDSRGFVQANEVRGAERALYCAGVISVDDDGRPMHDGDMRAQAMRALDNLETILLEAGYELADVMRLTIYTTDMDAYLGAAPEVRARLAAAGCRPASTLLGISRLAMPQLLIELEATAVK